MISVILDFVRRIYLFPVYTLDIDVFYDVSLNKLSSKQ